MGGRWSGLTALGLLAASLVAQGSPGVHLELRGADGKVLGSRTLRLLALHEAWPKPSGADPAIDLAVFQGQIEIAHRQRIAFRVEASGPVTVVVGDETLISLPAAGSGESAAKRLRAGKVPISVQLRRSAASDLSLRLSWSAAEFGWEPIPPHAWSQTTRPDEDGLADRGRELYLTHRCGACHETLPGEEESAWPAPSLIQAGARFDPTWIQEWVMDPSSLRPNARMPRLLHGQASDPADQTAADLQAFLTGMGSPPPLPASEGAAVKEGGHLFDGLGCVGCHLRPEHAELPLDDRIPLRKASTKFVGDSLTAFLLDPGRHFPGTRMPHFALSHAEANALANYLHQAGANPKPVRLRGDAARGAIAYEKLACGSCHGDGTTGALAPTKKRPRPRSAGGCLEEAPAVAPRFDFSASERDALGRYLAAPILEPETPSELSHRWVRELRCQACHARDHESDWWSEFVLETKDLARPVTGKRVAQLRPHLTLAGDKLRPEWVERLLAGDPGTRVRPWLDARMPAFPTRAAGLARGLAAEHGHSTTAEAPPPPDPELVSAGQHLIGKDGFACTACHGIGSEAPYAEFEIGAINFVETAPRLRRGWFDRWMRDPRRIDPASRMPTYSNGEGGSQIEEILGGNLERQFEAIWTALPR